MIKFDKINNLARITLNRPDKFNAFVREMALDLQAKLDQCEKDDTIRCVLITGCGKAFSADTTEEDFDIKEEASNAQIRSAFKKFSKNKKLNKVLMTNFGKAVA